MIVEKDDFVRAKIAAGATAGQLRRALADIPDDAVLCDAEITEFDFRHEEPFPLKIELRVEWVKQPEDDIPGKGGVSS
ncbi:hypothetical protein SEA_MAGRITTE_231 [Microbacterium phage Magritte]|nr:hypothetical protein SEA_MAGRITTE_231 [Microbacterium phage Magritte]